MKNLAEPRLKLKPETRRMLKAFCWVFFPLYAVAVLAFGLAGRTFDYQAALFVSEHLARGLRVGFGLLCLGVLFMECKETRA